MVHVTTKHGEEAYQCEICELHFNEENVAKKCQTWCSNHESCNYPIASQSIQAQLQKNTSTKQ